MGNLTRSGRATLSAARTPKRAICRLNHVAVRGVEYGREIGRDSEVDLHEIVAPGVTLEQALGDLVQSFTLIDAPPSADVDDETEE